MLSRFTVLQRQSLLLLLQGALLYHSTYIFPPERLVWTQFHRALLLLSAETAPAPSLAHPNY